MKKISSLLIVLFGIPLFGMAQDAATEEQLNKLRSEVSTLQESNVALKKRLEDVSKELQEVREQATKPSGNYADATDVKKLAEAVKEVDRKREADKEVILGEIKTLGTSLKSGTTRPPKKSGDGSGSTGDKEKTPPADGGYEYTIQSGDNLSTIVAGCRKQGVKVTLDQVLKANPNLKPESLKVGQKITIPAPPQ